MADETPTTATPPPDAPTPETPRPSRPTPKGVTAGEGATTGAALLAQAEERKAQEREANTEILGQLLSWETKHSSEVAALFCALSKAQGKIKHATRDATNPFFKSKYADLAATWTACREPLAENGICVIQIPMSHGRLALVTTILGHESGQWFEGRLAMVSREDTPQAVGGLITYARRYSLAAMVGVAAEDDDGNAASVDRPDARQDPGRTRLQQTLATGQRDELPDAPPAEVPKGPATAPSSPAPVAARPGAGTVPPPGARPTPRPTPRATPAPEVEKAVAPSVPSAPVQPKQEGTVVHPPPPGMRPPQRLPRE